MTAEHEEPGLPSVLLSLVIVLAMLFVVVLGAYGLAYAILQALAAMVGLLT